MKEVAEVTMSLEETERAEGFHLGVLSLEMTEQKCNVALSMNPRAGVC